jgi:hypothetical protein
MSRPHRTTNIRARRHAGPSVAVMDAYVDGGRKREELVLVRNGKALRHSPKVGTPPHWRAGKDNEMDWIEPAGRD